MAFNVLDAGPITSPTPFADQLKAPLPLLVKTVLAAPCVGGSVNTWVDAPFAATNDIKFELFDSKTNGCGIPPNIAPNLNPPPSIITGT